MSERSAIVWFAILLIAITLAMSVVAFIFTRMACEARWSDYQHRFSIIGGCQVKIDGKWTPEDRIREFAA